jgi:hypothetical protein
VTRTRPVRIPVDGFDGSVSGLFQRPRGAKALLLFGHGAGAGMEHPFMSDMSTALAQVGIATLRYQFPYMEKGRRPPSPRPLLLATVRAACAAANRRARGLPLFVGGKSMGGRMTSLAFAQGGLSKSLRGLVFFGFPLHPPGRTGVERAEHLSSVHVPMLFLQGTRDKLAALDELRPVCEALKPRVRLHIVEGADHGFDVLVRSGRTSGDVRQELAHAVSRFIDRNSP